MTTVLISGRGAVPVPLRALVERGSTAFHEYRADELGSGTAVAADRVVFWSAEDDEDVQRLAERYAKAEVAARREVLVFVTAETGGATPPAGLSPHEIFVWPKDEDRLAMAFLTGA